MRKMTRCNLCHHPKPIFLFSSTDPMYSIPDKYSIVRCRRCGLIFIDPQPSMKELAKHYPAKEYVSLRGKSSQSSMQTLLHRTYLSGKGSLLHKILFFPLKTLLRSVRTVKGGRFLDVGCGSGHFLANLKNAGMDLYGVEPGDFDTSFAKKYRIKIRKGDLISAKFPENYFDVITINHVFEHVHDPRTTIRELYRILKKGGTLIIGTPVSDSLACRMFGKDWLLLDPPRHLFTFSSRNLKEYAKKAGFGIEKIRYNSVPAHFLGSILLWSNRFRKKPVLFSESGFVRSRILFILLLPFILFLNLIRQGDQVEMFLRKS